jgi:phage shock protein PspC (stress-responsive transcriptional regulator)
MENTTTHPQDSDRGTAGREAHTFDRSMPLFRPVQDRMLAGVAAGIARYLGADVTVVRIILAVLTAMGGAGVPIYLAGWLLIPDEGAAQSIASELIQSLSGSQSGSQSARSH